MTHKTKGVVLRTIKYGETSVITSVYTELFGIQQYIVKGIRKSTQKSQGGANYFQPAAILDLEVYHNELKNLQFIKEFHWNYLYENVFFNVVKNAVAVYVVELLQHCLKQPESNSELFFLLEDTLKQLDQANDSLTANLPLYFNLFLANELGFRMLGEYSAQTPVLDLKEGLFISENPMHSNYIINETAQLTSKLYAVKSYHDLENLHLNRYLRRQLLEAYLQFIALHIDDFGELKSLRILQEILN